MIELNIEKAKILLTSALETFLTFNDDIECYNHSYLDNDEDNFVIASLYEYIDAVKIIKAYENTDEKLFLINCSILDDDIVITIKYSDEVPYMITLENFDDKWVYNEHLSVIKESKVVIDNRIKNFYKSRLEERSELKEKLSYEDITKKLFYTGNNNSHLKKFYDLKKQYNGKDVSNIKVVTANVSDEGYCDVLFSVKATKDGKKKKELVGENGELVDNISDEYQITLRINDFWDLIDEFGLEKKNDFTKNDVVALIQLSQDIKLSDSTPSFWWMGTSYYLTQDDASLMPCNIAPKFWNRDDLRPNVKVSKSMEGVLKNLGFFVQQIAMSIKKNLKEQGYIV